MKTFYPPTLPTTTPASQIFSYINQSPLPSPTLNSHIPQLVTVIILSQVPSHLAICKLANMKKTSNTESSKLDRKTIERNRRIHMKNLCFKLASLIPPHYIKPTKDMMSQQDQLDLAAAYIKHVKERIEKLKGKKEQALRSSASNSSSSSSNVLNQIFINSKLPVLELRDMGSCIEVMLITGLNKNFMLYEVISILEEEGAEVVSASFSTVGDKIFHTVHAQVKISRVGVESSRVHQRLGELIATLESWDCLA